MDIINKIWEWLMKYLPTIWGIMLVAAITTGLLAMMAAFVKLFFQATGVL